MVHLARGQSNALTACARGGSQWVLRASTHDIAGDGNSHSSRMTRGRVARLGTTRPAVGRRMSDGRWSWGSAGAASGGTVVGVPVGGALGILTAPAAGFGDSVADYGPALLATVGSACVLGLAGCYLALRFVGDPRALPTVIILAVLLPGSALSVEPVGRALADTFDWTFGVLIPVGVVLYVSCPVLSPVLARLIAGLLPGSDSQPTEGG